MLQRLQGPQEDPEEFHVFFLLCPCGIIEEQKKNQIVVVSWQLLNCFGSKLYSHPAPSIPRTGSGSTPYTDQDIVLNEDE